MPPPIFLKVVEYPTEIILKLEELTALGLQDILQQIEEFKLSAEEELNKRNEAQESLRKCICTEGRHEGERIDCDCLCHEKED